MNRSRLKMPESADKGTNSLKGELGQQENAFGLLMKGYRAAATEKTTSMEVAWEF